jgi:4-amino-4-deoxy-L-arabinose transferase-like glycosyltransferase
LLKFRLCQKAMRVPPTISLFKPILAAIALCAWLCLLLPSLDRNRLQDVDELWHARTAQIAAVDGHWWPLMLDGRPFFEKPPLVLWLAGATAKASGQPQAAWPYRLWNTLGAALLLGSLIVLGFWADRFWGVLGATAWLALQGDFIFHSRFFSMDTPFLGLAFAGVACLALAVERGPRSKVWVAAGLLLALAFWCKSWFVLALAPALAGALWLTVPAGQRQKPAVKLLAPLAVAILAWLALYTAWSGNGFLRQEWQANIAGRLAWGQTGGNPLEYYLSWAQRSAPAVLVLVLMLPLGLWPRRSADPRQAFIQVFAWALSASWLIGLLLVQVPTINYLLPLEAALALSLGLGLTENESTSVQGLLALGLLLASVAMQRWGPAWIYLALGGLLGLSLAWMRQRPGPRHPAGWLLKISALLLLCLQVPDAVGLCARPLDSHRELAALLLAHEPAKAGDPLWAVGIPSRAVDFYSHYQVHHVDSLAAVPAGQAMLYLGAKGLSFVPASENSQPLRHP